VSTICLDGATAITSELNASGPAPTSASPVFGTIVVFSVTVNWPAAFVVAVAITRSLYFSGGGTLSGGDRKRGQGHQ
jgi:hypothetical protein